MDFSKPKVTIDLDEYNYLKDKEQEDYSEFELILISLFKFINTSPPYPTVDEINKFLHGNIRRNIVKDNNTGIIKIIKTN